ncbi:MAG: hypothetical protein A2018_03095 [Alphaproteobacteria bacterium GWF2_58_20]|nr:MAG: hypothetical protein A2018_03095 [Alphaproteobacteria bacterium GWF2_58_20]
MKQGSLFVASAAMLSAMPAFAAIPLPVRKPPVKRILSLYDEGRKNRIRIPYHDGENYLSDAMDDLAWFMRDHRTGEAHVIDPKLLDYMYLVHARSGSDEPLHVISGYRSKATNDRLRKTMDGVAKNSYHLLGRAVDFRLPDVKLSFVRKVALAIRGGGVGYYPSHHFIHIDSGPIRKW